MPNDFDASKEPLRALRDLIVACEMIFGGDNGEQRILDRAREGFTALRAHFGDHRPGEEIADGPLGCEPNFVPEIDSGERHVAARE